jgi:hypothetical protein
MAQLNEQSKGTGDYWQIKQPMTAKRMALLKGQSKGIGD